LTTQEWRELRLRAAENGTSVEKVIAGILRHELATMVTRRAEGQPPRR
jgi:plasmid stability protein